MALPTNRNDFKELILQRLGKGILRIEVTDDQVENLIDYAIKKAQDYHFDFSQDTFYKYQLTQTDIDNHWIPLPNDTIGVIEIFDLVSTLMGVGMWNVQYQFILANLPNWSTMDLQNYWMTMSNLQFMQQILVGKQPIRYNRYINRLYIDMDWSMVTPDQFLIVKIYEALDPTVYTAIWADQWLIRYTTELVKKQWGNNLKKTVMDLPNGGKYNGQQIYDEAQTELEKLDAELINSYSLPASFMIG